MLAEKILSPGLKGIFYAALFATILSTLNSFLFLSATTFGRDFVFKLEKKRNEEYVNKYTRIGLSFAVVVSVILAYFINSVIELWYVIGTVVIPSIILLVVSSYYEKFKISKRGAIIEIVMALIGSVGWLIVRPIFEGSVLYEIEPMIVGLVFSILVHSYYLFRGRFVVS